MLVNHEQNLKQQSEQQPKQNEMVLKKTPQIAPTAIPETWAPHHYTYGVRFDAQADTYVGYVLEMPDIQYVSPIRDPDDAILGIMDQIATLLEQQQTAEPVLLQLLRLQESEKGTEHAIDLFAHTPKLLSQEATKIEEIREIREITNIKNTHPQNCACCTTEAATLLVRLEQFPKSQIPKSQIYKPQNKLK